MEFYKLLIDYREKHFINLINDNNLNKIKIEFEIKTLDIGDIIIQKKNDPLIIIERKTVCDLLASIKDGRYKEQKYRILEAYNKLPIKCIYLIEGTFDYYKSNTKNYEMIWGAMVNIMIRDNLFIFRTNSIEESYKFICKLFKNIHNFELNNIQLNDSNLSYTECIKSKKKLKDINNVFNMQLQQIPGISSGIASCIQAKYSCFNELINDYNKYETEKDKEQLISNLTYLCKTNKKRRIGEVISKRIYQYLFNIENE